MGWCGGGRIARIAKKTKNTSTGKTLSEWRGGRLGKSSKNNMKIKNTQNSRRVLAAQATKWKGGRLGKNSKNNKKSNNTQNFRRCQQGTEWQSARAE